MCKNIIEAIGANFRGTKLHYYSNAGVTNTGQEPLSPNCTSHATKFGLQVLLPAENEKPERIERNFHNFMWTSR